MTKDDAYPRFESFTEPYSPPTKEQTAQVRAYRYYREGGPVVFIDTFDFGRVAETRLRIMHLIPSVDIKPFLPKLPLPFRFPA